jgi:Flp pilus assembly protein TadD
MRLNPTAAEPHRFAARCLAAAGRDSLARQEYRLAFLFGDREALKEAARRYSTLDELLTIVPDTPAGLGALSSLLLGMKRPTDAAEVLRRSWDEFRSLDALRSLSSVALQLGELEEALALARRLREQQPLDPASYLVASSALARVGRAEEARAELEQGVSRIPGSPPIVAALAEQALAARRFSEAARLAETMAARTAPEIASKRLFLARVFWAQGRMAEAIQEARSARDAVPNDAGPLLALASYCSQAGRYDEAIAAVERARSLPGARPGAYDSRLAELRTARQAQIDRRNREQYLGNPAPLPR